MGLDNLTDVEIEQKANDFLADDISDEQRDQLEKEIGVAEPDSTEKPEELIAEVVIDDGEEPATPSDTSSPSNQTKQTDTSAPPATATPEISDEVYNSIIQANPSLAKYPKDKFISELAKGYTNLETKLGTPRQPDNKPPEITDVQLRAQMNQQVLANTERLVKADVEIARLLTVKDANGVTTMLPLPVTEDEWADFMDNYPARYTEIKSRAKEIYATVKDTIETRVVKQASAPQENEKRGLDFVQKIEDYYKGINPKLSETEIKEISTRVENFYNKALPNTSRYYINDNGVLFLNPEVMFADYMVENIDLTTKLMSMSIVNNNSQKFADTANKIRNGVSMKTTGNSGQSGKATKKTMNVNILSERDRGSLPDDILNSLIAETEK